MIQLKVKNEEELRSLIQQILDFCKSEKIILFRGEMGSGKTTLIRMIGQHLGVHNHISSPTFSIVNEYTYPGGLIYHFDFYRIKNEQEALDFGSEEYFDSGQLCFIEWPEKIPQLLPSSYTLIQIQADGESKDSRTLSLSLYPPSV